MVQIYNPMAAFKSVDQQFFERRQDYQDQITVHNFYPGEMRSLIYALYEDIEVSRENKKKSIIEDGKTAWLVNRIKYKLPLYFELAKKVTQKTEELQVKLWDIVIDNIA
jgi:hypothetical protein